MTPLTFDPIDRLRERADALQGALATFAEESGDALALAAELVAGAVLEGRTVFACGNGGSAAHAMHLEAELLGRFREDRAPLPSVYLGASAPTSTAVANDYGDELIFARPLEALSRTGDLLVALSTSGLSPNILRALEAAGRCRVGTVLLSGPNAPDVGDVVLRFPGTTADQIQEGHQLLVHLLVEAAEASLER